MRVIKSAKNILVVLIIVFITVTGYIYFSEQNKPVDDFIILTIGTADRGGTMYPVGNEIAKVISENSQIKTKVNISASSGSAANVSGLSNDQIDLGLISGDIALAAYEGTDEFTENPHKNLRAIAALYSSVSTWVAPADSPIIYVNQLKGKNIAVGPQSSTSELAARTALGVLNIDDTNTNIINYSLVTASEALENGEIDAFHGFAGVPISVLEQFSQMEFKLLRYTPGELKEILKLNPSYGKRTIKANSYVGQPQNVETFGVKCLLVVNADMDENLVFSITKAIAQSVPQLIAENQAVAEMADFNFIFEELPIPLHNGALKYYNENK